VARIGGVEIHGHEELPDSGLALLVTNPPKEAHRFAHRQANLEISPGLPFVICSFRGAASHLEALEIGGALIQEGLDLLSITGIADLATRNITDEYFVWWKHGGVRTACVVSTTTLSFSVPAIKMTIRTEAGGVSSSRQTPPTYHAAYRFYRLSQTSDDLFDAFRNMYLAFELLLSTRYPKLKENAPVEIVIQSISTHTRLPLFHAKNGKTYFAPYHSVSDSDAVGTSLMLLTSLVLRMAEKWEQSRRQGGGVFFGWVRESLKTMLTTGQFLLSNSALVLDDDVNLRNFEHDLPFDAKWHETFSGQKRIHVHGSIDLNLARFEGPLRSIRLISGEEPVALLSLEADFELDGFAQLEVVNFLNLRNVNQPRSFFPR
jgi:hypothetical protein